MGELLVVYDTTAFRNLHHDWDHPTLKTIREARHELGFRIAVPEVVVRECQGQVERGIRDNWNKSADLVGRLAKKAGVPASTIMDMKGRDPLAKQGAELVRQRIEGDYDEVLPLPAVKVGQLVDRAVSQKRPFGDGKGKGMRDYLIWLSILEAKARYGSRVAFVTANKSDFGAGDRLAPDLVEDLAAQGEPEQGVMLVRDPEELLNRVVIPSMEAVDDIAGQSIEQALGPAVVDDVTSGLSDALDRLDFLVDLVAAKESRDDDEEWFLGTEPRIAYVESVGAIRRIVILPTGERMVDADATWCSVAEDDNRQRPDEPWDEYDIDWSGTIRFIVAANGKAAYATRIITATIDAVGDLSETSRRELDWFRDAQDARADEYLGLMDFAEPAEPPSEPD